MRRWWPAALAAVFLLHLIGAALWAREGRRRREAEALVSRVPGSDLAASQPITITGGASYTTSMAPAPVSTCSRCGRATYASGWYSSYANTNITIHLLDGRRKWRGCWECLEDFFLAADAAGITTATPSAGERAVTR